MPVSGKILIFKEVATETDDIIFHFSDNFLNFVKIKRVTASFKNLFNSQLMNNNN